MRNGILRANAASCLIFGLVFAVWPSEVAAFLGDPPGWLILVTGLGLIPYGLLLLWTARGRVTATDLRLFALGDAAWVAITLVLIPAGIWITTANGIAAALAVAAMVGTFGVIQWYLAGGEEVPES